MCFNSLFQTSESRGPAASPPKKKGGSRSRRPWSYTDEGLEVELGCDLHVARSEEETAVVAAGSRSEVSSANCRILKCQRARRRPAQLICRSSDTIDVLVVGDIEDVQQQLDIVALRNRNLLIDAHVIHDVAGGLVSVASDHWEKGRKAVSIPPLQDCGRRVVAAADGRRVRQSTSRLEAVVNIPVVGEVLEDAVAVDARNV